jgi:hypothetical protein
MSAGSWETNALPLACGRPDLTEQADTIDPAAPAPAAKPRMPFRRFVAKTRMTPDDARRQSSIVQAAWKSFGEREPAMAFLNTHQDELDGRPLDIATASDEGLAAIQQLLAERTS